MNQAIDVSVEGGENYDMLVEILTSHSIWVSMQIF